MRDPERPDLSAFEWDYTQRRESMVSHILWRTAEELERRRQAGTFGLFDGLLAWARPALATAAVLALISLYALSHQTQPGAGGALTGAFFRSSSLPGPLQAWIEAGEPPTANYIVLTSGEGN